MPTTSTIHGCIAAPVAGVGVYRHGRSGAASSAVTQCVSSAAVSPLTGTVVVTAPRRSPRTSRGPSSSTPTVRVSYPPLSGSRARRRMFATNRPPVATPDAAARSHPRKVSRSPAI